MATSQEIEEFLAAYTGSWESQRDWSKPIFHPGGGVRYPGSSAVVNPDKPPSMTDRLRRIAPDLQIRLLAWAERNDVLFAEWELTCTLSGRPLRIEAVNRFCLAGNRATEAVAFVDRLSVVEFLDPGRERTTLGELLARAARRAPDPHTDSTEPSLTAAGASLRS